MIPVVNYQLRRNPSGYSSITPVPTANELGNFYSEQYYQSLQTVSYQETYDALEINYKTLKCSALLHAIRQAGVSDGKFLDIGAGEGFLMNEATKCGYDITGIDFSSFALDRFFPHLAEKLISGDLYEVLGACELKAGGFRCALQLMCLNMSLTQNYSCPSSGGSWFLAHFWQSRYLTTFRNYMSYCALTK